jgi:hypothetical protein
MSVDMRMTCSAVPLQFEGTVDGNPAYFRARFQHWYFTIVRPGAEPVRPEPDNNLLFFREEQWGDGEYAAGYMPELIGRQKINQCVKDWRLGKTE